MEDLANVWWARENKGGNQWGDGEKGLVGGSTQRGLPFRASILPLSHILSWTLSSPGKSSRGVGVHGVGAENMWCVARCGRAFGVSVLVWRVCLSQSCYVQGVEF